MSSITVGVTEAAPPGGCIVKFDRPVPIFSMGHDHGVHPQSKAGRVEPDLCVIPEGALICPDSPRYIASEIAGQEQIIARLVGTDGQTLEQSATTVNIRVPELGALGASSAYRLTGAFGEPGVTSQHTENHNGTGSTITRLIIIANDYLQDTEYTLGINDISLPFGGLFDIGNNWDPPHNLHREGKSADIDRTVVKLGDPTDSVTINCQDDVNLQRIVEDNNLGDLICESGGRKHIEFP
ncbi:MAG: hypothetical protein ACREIQ_08260 [Nitrospiria bacterium]